MSLSDVIRGRKAIKAFASTPIPTETLAEILRLTQVQRATYYCSIVPIT